MDGAEGKHYLNLYSRGYISPVGNKFHTVLKMISKSPIKYKKGKEDLNLHPAVTRAIILLMQHTNIKVLKDALAC
jgi:hypothetical protein